MVTAIGGGCWFLLEISSDKGEIKDWGFTLKGNESSNLLVAKASKIVGNKNLKIPKPDAHKQWNGLCLGLKEVNPASHFSLMADGWPTTTLPP